MKKKLIIIALIVLLATPALAFNLGGSAKKVKVFESRNATGSIVTRSAAVIGSSHKVLGMVAIKASPGGSGCVELYDTPWGQTTAEVIAEVEADDSNGGSKWFYYPLTVADSITIRQGENTSVLIYYE